ncbi:MAG: hypothetical protein M1549_00015 [Candidatus Dependentiae bacterium]|nr:hypothetical protein [Candidatus Dependentiae bacterium]
MKKSLLMLLSLAMVSATIISACPCGNHKPKGESQSERGCGCNNQCGCNKPNCGCCGK